MDKTQLTSAGFASLAVGVLDASHFVSGAAPTANAATAQFLYNTTSGQLSFDADGSGAGVAINLVTPVGHPAIATEDLAVVA